MGLVMNLLRRLFPRLSRHRARRDEDLQGRPARPEVESKLTQIMARRYLQRDRTKSWTTPRRPRSRRSWPMRRIGARYWRERKNGAFGNPRWMRREGVTPFGMSSRSQDQ